MDKNPPKGITYYSKFHDLCFYVLGNEENSIESNIVVTNKEVMKGDKPMAEGVYDAHMGSTDHSWTCQTCGCKKTICPGHFGSIELKYPVKSPMYREELLKWLKITCFYCGSIVIRLKSKVRPSKRLSEYVKNVRGVKNCIKCNQPHMQVVKDKKKPAVFYRVYEEAKMIQKKEYYNHEIEKAVQRITDLNVIKMGKPLRSHPKKFILRVLKVSPNTIRPDLRRIGGARSSNSDTTSLLKAIMEINDSLPDEIPLALDMGNEIQNTYFNLDMTVYAMLKGGGGGDIKLVTNTNKPPVAIAEHFPKKTGRIRKNLMGKRVEYMIRSVITGDAMLKIDEVGIPMTHARNLEIPEIVNRQNRDRLMLYYMNKTNTYPGCKRIIKAENGRVYRINLLDPNYQLQIGDTVLRDMITGDVVNFNRQPSLLFSSIIGMKVVIMETGDTLRLNPAICKMFNADFDGDQMSAIVPQDIQPRVECAMVSKASRWFISAKNHSPFVGAFQDGLIGLAELTKHDMNFNKWHAMSVFADISLNTANYMFDKSSYTSRQIVSKILPTINLVGKSPSIYKEEYAKLLKYHPDDIRVSIIRGELQKGILDKATCGEGVIGSIFQTIANEYSNDYSLDVIYNLQQLTHKFFHYHGFTVGIGDVCIKEDAMKEVKRRLTTLILESRKITQRLDNGKLIAPIGMPLKQHYENEQLNALARGDDFVYPIFASIDLENNMIARLILTGSKGKIPDFININGALGALTINGRRFPSQVGWGRTSPYFVRYDTDPEANGFVASSYREGVSSIVYPFLAGETRHNMINNALSTSITGNQNRISIKNLESIIIDNLRKSTKGHNVIQPLYADCGLEPAKMEKVKFPTVMISTEKFNEYHSNANQFDKRHHSKHVQTLLDEEFKQLTDDRNRYRSIHLQMEDHNPKEYVLADNKQMPVNVGRIVDDTVYNYASRFEELNAVDLQLNPENCILLVRDLCEKLGYVFINELQKKLGRKIPTHIKTSTILMQILIRSHLCTSNLLKKNVTQPMLDIILQKIVQIYRKALIAYGSTVGILAAQCVSEPMTQFMLDSKHRAGGRIGSAAGEIARIQEILSAKDTDAMKNPRMTIMVKKEFENDKIKVQEISSHIEMMTFVRFVKTTHIFFETYGKPVYKEFAAEEKTISLIEKHNLGQRIPSDLAKWCIRFQVDKEELILKSMKLETMVLAIRKSLPETFIVYTTENSENVFLRCYMRNNSFKQTESFYEDCVLPLMNKIKNVIVRGIEGLISTSVIDAVKTVEKPDGSLELSKIFVIAAVGTNLVSTMLDPYIDPYRTQSDSIEECERIFGLVAARNKIINELAMASVELNKYHCSIFADEMCYSGVVSSIQKTGLQKRENANITLRLSFQTPIQVITESAINGMCDNIGGISGPLIMGTNPRIGTCYNTVCLNEEFIKQNTIKIENLIDEL